MIIFYHPNYNIDFGIFNRLHPFDGRKFLHVYDKIKYLPGIVIQAPEKPVSQVEVDKFSDSLFKLLLHKKRYVLRALEVPYIPLIPFSFVDKHILQPMRWGVAGTLEATRHALSGNHCWNLAGGYHHSSRAAAEGFCIYNDIGITIDVLNDEGKINQDTRMLIIDVDAHHGNGNCYIFYENRNVTILDIYNNDIYPVNDYTKERVDINVPLHSGTNGQFYLDKLDGALSSIKNDFDIAFVIAGTDVIDSDPLGGFKLTIDDCVTRDVMILDKLSELSIPSVFLGGGGYSKESAITITASITKLYGVE